MLCGIPSRVGFCAVRDNGRISTVEAAEVATQAPRHETWCPALPRLAAWPSASADDGLSIAFAVACGFRSAALTLRCFLRDSFSKIRSRCTATCTARSHSRHVDRLPDGPQYQSLLRRSMAQGNYRTLIGLRGTPQDSPSVSEV